MPEPKPLNVRGKRELHWHDVKKISVFICCLVQIIIIMSQYEEMYLGRLKCELRKHDGRVTGRKWKCFNKLQLLSKWCLSHMSDARTLFLSSQVINSKQPYLGLTQESLGMVTVRVLVVLSGSFTSQIETGPTLT